jgi:putative FmdB family regulatory protein
MPTYEFRCPRGHEFEKFYRTISGAEAQAACPHCGLLAERMMSPAGFAFKGSGFYLTDYGKNAHRDKGAAEPQAPVSAGDGAKDSTPAGGASADAKGEGAKGSDSSNGSSANAKTPAPAAEAKPAAPAPKKSSGE